MYLRGGRRRKWPFHNLQHKVEAQKYNSQKLQKLLKLNIYFVMDIFIIVLTEMKALSAKREEL